MATDTTLTETKLTDAQWQIADAIARQLVIDDTDVNELRKAIAYLREYIEKEKIEKKDTDQKQAGKKFFDYLKTLVRQGKTIGHSKRTIEYYRSLDDVCGQYLVNYQDDAPVMLHLLGWVARLVQYYDKGVPTGEISKPEVMSEREAELKVVKDSNTFEVGQQLEAKVTAIKGNKVTYEMIGTIRLTQKEPKRAGSMSEGQTMKVEVIQLRSDGLVKKVKPCE